MPTRATDARDEIDASILADPRVRQFWDGSAVSGRWLADADIGGQGYAGIVYDAFFVFGPKATWDGEPGPLLASGAPVISEGEKLLTAIRSQL